LTSETRDLTTDWPTFDACGASSYALSKPNSRDWKQNSAGLVEVGSVVAQLELKPTEVVDFVVAELTIE